MLHCINHCALMKHLLHTRLLGIYRNNQIYWHCSQRLCSLIEEASYDPLSANWCGASIYDAPLPMAILKKMGTWLLF